MTTCQDCGSFKTEANGICASCNHARRKEERNANKVKVVKPLKRVSDKRKGENKEYTPLRQQFIKDHPNCELKLIGCTGKSEDVHHCAKRGLNFLNVKTWKAGCRHCHTILETKLSAAERRKKGFLI